MAHTSVAASSLQSGQPILSPGDEGPGWWDGLSSASPVVLPPSSFDSRWRMWYYGRDATTWADGAKPFLPTGRIGLAVSDDGLAWRRVQGPLQGGASLDPCASKAAFDSLHVGVGDVVQLPNGTLWMYYFGGDARATPLPGIRMQVGLATSQDGGVSWQRLDSHKPVLCAGGPGEFDELFASWPRVLPPWKTKNVLGLPTGKWYMSYHTYNLSQWSVGAAFSDDGVEWERVQGPILTGGREGSWDSVGVGVRSLVVVEDHLLMFYEAVDDSGGHAIGSAKSPDGIVWQKCRVPGCANLGGPLLTKGPLGSFDEKHLGTPYVVPSYSNGGNWRLYFVGAKLDATMESPHLAIGMAESFGDDLMKWQKVGD